MPCLRAERGRSKHQIMSCNNLVLIIAGHYCIASDYSALSNLAETEINSLILGIEHYQDALQQGQQAKLVIWINDIGITPMEREQYQRSYRLPYNYANLLMQADMPENDIIIRFESRARNRASKIVGQLKRRYPDVISELFADDSGLIRCVDTESCFSNNTKQKVLTIQDEIGSPLVIKEGDSAKCCAILAQFFSELERVYQPVKIISVFNFFYTERIKLGLYVADTLLEFNTPVYCSFCDETSVITNSDFSKAANTIGKS